MDDRKLFVNVLCAYCGKTFPKELRRFNENVKRGWSFYCSIKCGNLNKIKQTEYICSNSSCSKVFKRRPKEIVSSGRHFCSSSCAAAVNNKLFPKIVAKTKFCPTCGKKFKGRNTFCSADCIRTNKITEEDVLTRIRDFYKKFHRIPLKEEFLHDRAARILFGTWNKAIIAAGYSPNPVRFAKKYIANDGHKCDSLAEKIIDDWLFRRKIKHKRSVPYPVCNEFRVDFLIGEKWVEFFGLTGQLKKYDTLKRKKIRLAKKLNLKLIEIYPPDLFVNQQLEKLLLNGD